MRSPLLLIVLVAGCSFDPSGPATTDDGSPDDGAAIDSAVIDGATIDGATIDAAAIDARITDAAAIDAPPPIDARPIDAPPPIDARPIDAPPPRCVGYQVVTGAPATSRYRKVNTLTTWAGADADRAADVDEHRRGGVVGRGRAGAGHDGEQRRGRTDHGLHSHAYSCVPSSYQSQKRPLSSTRT